MSYFLKSGSTFKVTSKEAMDLHEKLPAGNYIICKDQFENLFLEQIDNFIVPAKMYGDVLRHTERIVNTFNDRDVSTGIMLSGEKGSGKTMLVKNIAIALAKQGVPTIVINSPWSGDKFNKLLQDIEQPCMVLFDEFEKVYDSDQQEEILTLLDGVFGSKKLYALTCNDKWRVDIHMRNRPGRIFYMIDFKGLAIEFIVEYCNDNLKNKEHIETICTISSLFSEFNFDMLTALIEEMNRYNESPQDALRILNAKPEFDGTSNYTVSIIHNGIPIKNEHIYPSTFKGNPMQTGLEVSFNKTPDKEDGDWTDINFIPNQLVSVDAREGKFVFQDHGTSIVLIREKEQSYNYYSKVF